MTIFGIEEVIAQKSHDFDEMIPVRAIHFPKRFGSLAIKMLTRHITMQELNLDHLKRIKKFDDDRLIALVDKQIKPENSSSDYIYQLGGWLKDIEGQISTVYVHRFPPSSIEEFRRSHEIWPTVFHPNTSSEIKNAVSETEKMSMVSNMLHAIIDAKSDPFLRIFPSSECISSGAIVVDPERNEVIARASITGGRERLPNDRNPLFHAVLRVIEQVSFDEHAKKQHKTSLHEKKKPLQPNDDESSYLCTGYDVYTVQEPCLMCAMALVHSRARRVIYGAPNEMMGALGSVVSLHHLRSLNHHYRVFRNVLGSDCAEALKRNAR